MRLPLTRTTSRSPPLGSRTVSLRGSTHLAFARGSGGEFARARIGHFSRQVEDGLLRVVELRCEAQLDGHVTGARLQPVSPDQIRHAGVDAEVVGQRGLVRLDGAQSGSPEYQARVLGGAKRLAEGGPADVELGRQLRLGGQAVTGSLCR